MNFKVHFSYYWKSFKATIFRNTAYITYKTNHYEQKSYDLLLCSN